MNHLDRLLAKTPQSTSSWHCPWFRLIEALCLQGIFFGAVSYFAYGAVFGLVAVIIGAATGAFSLGNRSRGVASC